MRHFILIAALLPTTAWAECQNGSQVFSCVIKSKVLEVCHRNGALIYSFGTRGGPDLTISEPLESVQFTPWPGIGTSIWETVTFQNDGYAYEVWTSVERDSLVTKVDDGGVNVLRDDKVVAHLTCHPGTASNSLGVIWNLKEAIGQCWDFESRSWQTACSN